jgi:hypothetical protein
MMALTVATNVVVLLSILGAIAVAAKCIQAHNTPAALGWGVAAIWATIHLSSRLFFH